MFIVFFLYILQLLKQMEVSSLVSSFYLIGFLTLLSLSQSLILEIYVYFLDNCLQEKCMRNGILRKGRYLESRDQIFKLHLRENGNLVLTCQNRSIWTTFTSNKSVDFLYFDREGTSLALRGKNNSNVWKIQTSALGKELVLQENGKLVLYNSCNASIWEKGGKKLCKKGLFSFLNIEFFISQIITYTENKRDSQVV